MVQKLLAAVVALLLAVGGVIAAETIRGTFVKYDDGKITVKVDDKEKTYPVADNAIYKGKKEVPIANWAKRAKEGAKLTLTVDGGKVTEVKGGGKGGK